MSATAAMDGTTTRDIAAPFLIPIATSQTGLTVGEAGSALANSPPTLEISGRRAPRVGLAGCKVILAATVQVEAAGRANYHRIRVLPTDRGEVAASASFPLIRVPTGPVPDRSVLRTGSLQEVSGADGADPRPPPVTEEVRSVEVAPGRPVSSATVELEAWAAVAFAVAEAVSAVAEAVLGAAGVGADAFPRNLRDRGAGLCQTNYCLRD
jgi:hypothetical protein